MPESKHDLVVDLVIPLLTRGGRVIEERKATLSVRGIPDGNEREAVELPLVAKVGDDSFPFTLTVPCQAAERASARHPGLVVEPRYREEVRVDRDEKDRIVAMLKEFY